MRMARCLVQRYPRAGDVSAVLLDLSPTFKSGGGKRKR